MYFALFIDIYVKLVLYVISIYFEKSLYKDSFFFTKVYGILKDFPDMTLHIFLLFMHWIPKTNTFK